MLKSRIVSVVAGLALVASSSGCYKTTLVQPEQQQSYEPVDAEGNVCKNQCNNTAEVCLGSATYYTQDDDGDVSRHKDSSAQRCDQERFVCWSQCSQHHGGDVKPYRQAQHDRKLDKGATYGLIGVCVGVLVLGGILGAVAPAEEDSEQP